MEQKFRKLLAHPESDSLWEVFSEQEYEDCLLNGDGYTEDVTDDPRWESIFKALQKNSTT